MKLKNNHLIPEDIEEKLQEEEHEKQKTPTRMQSNRKKKKKPSWHERFCTLKHLIIYNNHI